jgi:hypothetical protein
MTLFRILTHPDWRSTIRIHLVLRLGAHRRSRQTKLLSVTAQCRALSLHTGLDRVALSSAEAVEAAEALDAVAPAGESDRHLLHVAV